MSKETLKQVEIIIIFQDNMSENEVAQLTDGIQDFVDQNIPYATCDCWYDCQDLEEDDE